VGCYKTNSLTPMAPAPKSNPNPTSRSQSPSSIRTLKRNYAVIPRVFWLHSLKEG